MVERDRAREWSKESLCTICTVLYFAHPASVCRKTMAAQQLQMKHKVQLCSWHHQDD